MQMKKYMHEGTLREFYTPPTWSFAFLRASLAAGRRFLRSRDDAPLASYVTWNGVTLTFLR